MQHWNSKCKKYSVTLTTSFVSHATALAREHYPKEVGTALYGRYTECGYRAIVKGITPIAKDSVGHRSSFSGGVVGVVEFLTSLFYESKGSDYYIGEWHSHPNGAPVPSGTDDRSVFGIARDPRSRCQECILVIVSISEDGNAAVRAYVYSAKNGRIDLVHSTETL